LSLKKIRRSAYHSTLTEPETDGTCSTQGLNADQGFGEVSEMVIFRERDPEKQDVGKVAFKLERIKVLKQGMFPNAQDQESI
jgi:hypothetical protein